MGPSFTRLLVVLASLVIVVVGLHAAADFLAPVILGGFVVVLCMPIVEAFQRRGWPHWGAVLAATLLYVAAVAVLAIIGLISIRELVDLIPQLTAGAEGAESDTEGFLAPIIGAEAAAAVGTALRLAQFLPFLKDVALVLVQAAVLLGLAGLILISGADPNAEITHLPVLLIHGIQDERIPARIAERYAQAAGEAATLSVLDGDHLVLLKQADAAQATIRDWLVEQKAAAGR